MPEGWALDADGNPTTDAERAKQGSIAPFGHANPEPRFASADLLICETKRIGKDASHLKMKLRAEAMDPTDCIAWGQGDWADTSKPGDYLEAVFTPQINEWNGRRLLQFNLKDLRTRL